MTDERHKILRGDMRCELALMPDNSVDAIVCDPPYEIAFMGRGWDRSGIAFDPDTWRECLRVLKPGGYLVAFGACRTSHRITCAIEDAGFEIRDTLQWVFGSGFPKSLDVGKAIDKAAGAEREVVGSKYVSRILNPEDIKVHNYTVGLTGMDGDVPVTAPATVAARTWHGYGTALKPAHEPITLARKPLDGTVAANVAKWGTGGIDVDGCRVGESKRVPASRPNTTRGNGIYGAKNSGADAGHDPNVGRWPPNIILGDGAGEVIDGMAPKWNPRDSRVVNDNAARGVAYGDFKPTTRSLPPMSGNASEFFPTFHYTPKASRREREAGLAEAGIEPMTRADVTDRDEGSAGQKHGRSGITASGEIRNTHPTVKPVAIMQWLVRLVSPPRSLDPVILDPFAGSGSTGVACVREGVRFIGVELDERHAAIARARIAHAVRQKADTPDESTVTTSQAELPL